MSQLTIIILTKNEEKNIRECILTASSANEVLVIDDYSNDQTVAIAESLGARVIQHSLNGDWGQQRNFGIENAKGDWIMFLDADERISETLAASIHKAVTSDEKKAYWMKRHNLFQYNVATHGVLRPDKVLRLMPKEGAAVKGFVHETISSIYDLDILSGELYHYTYSDWEQYFNKFNKYTTLAAEKYKADGKKVYFLKDIIVRPIWAFIKIYFLQGGILDGKLGFILSINHYFYTMTKYVKFYYLQKSGGQL